MGKTIEFEWVDEPPKGKEAARFNLFLQGFEPGEQVTVELWEVDDHVDYVQHGDTKIGSISGTVFQAKGAVRQFLNASTAEGAIAAGPKGVNEVAIIFAVGEGKSYAFSPCSLGEADEGESWEIQARLKEDKAVRSLLWYISRRDRRVPWTQATYNWHDGHEVEFYNDGSTDATGTGGYFHDLSAAIDEAQQFILIADWSFHPYVRLTPGDARTIGDRLIAWAKADPKRLVAIHTWDHTKAGAPDSQNDDGGNIFKKELPMPANMLWRGSSRTGEDGGMGFGFSHHQKFVVMDGPCDTDKDKRRALRVYMGGLDLTQGRFDWPEHPVNGDDPGCAALLAVTFQARGVHNWYSAEFGAKTPLTKDKSSVDTTDSKFHPRQPWHDCHARITGPAAWDVVREFVGRWNLDPTWTPTQGQSSAAQIKQVRDFFVNRLFDKKVFVQQWEPHKGPFCAQILRSITRDHWGAKSPVVTPAAHKQNRTEFVWTIINQKHEESIQDSYLRAISQAERFIYIETQYFIGSGKDWTKKRNAVRNKLPSALAQRVGIQAALNRPFHVYLIVPMFPEGDPSSSVNQMQRDFQWRSIERLVRKVQADTGDWKKYLTIGFLANWTDLGGKAPQTSGDRVTRTRVNRRYMIYVHSKFMIVDDVFCIIGSANLNERSLHGGRDSEICCALGPGPATEKECRKSISEMRTRLWTEHFGGKPPKPDNPEDPANGAWMQTLGANNYSLMRSGKHNDGISTKQGHFCSWPIDGTVDGLGLHDKPHIIADGETGVIVGDDWYAWPTGDTLDSMDLAE